MDSAEIMALVHEIQGAADPNHPKETLKTRMAEIWEKACEIMDRTGYQP
jgi:hypothetical protein